MVNILFTGGAGFIGSSIIDKLNKKKYNIYVVDNLLTGTYKNIPIGNRVKFLKINVNDKKQLIKSTNKLSIDYIFHFAACVGVKRTLKNPLKVLEDIEGFKNILHLAKFKKVKRVFFSSSSEVYGEGQGLAQNEEKTPLNSRLPYAIVKNVGESFFKTYKNEYNINYTIFRLFNTYGPKQSSDFVVSQFLKNALKNKDINIYGNGQQSRTFCYIDDTVDAIINCFEKNFFINSTVNIGNNKVTKIIDLAKIIKKITKSNSKIKKIEPLKEGDMLRRKPDIKKMKSVLNRKFTSLEKGLYIILKEYE
tara:strand:+ start:4860 stop:5777 length:918 start_codon:yes stop_codon:yes gene_type:complete